MTYIFTIFSYVIQGYLWPEYGDQLTILQLMNLYQANDCNILSLMVLLILALMMIQPCLICLTEKLQTFAQFW